MDCFASLALTWLPLNTAPRSRGAMRPRFSKIIRPGVKRAQGMPGARCTRGLVRKTVQKKRTRAYRYRRGHPDIPCAMVLRLIARSPRRRIRLVTVADGLKDCLNPVGPTRLRQLDTSNGCQDHTVLPYAASRLRLKASPGTARFRTLGSSGHRRRSSARCVRSRTKARPANTTRARRCRVHRIPSQRP